MPFGENAPSEVKATSAQGSWIWNEALTILVAALTDGGFFVKGIFSIRRFRRRHSLWSRTSRDNALASDFEPNRRRVPCCLGAIKKLFPVGRAMARPD
jgi:hypothetical protein